MTGKFDAPVLFALVAMLSYGTADFIYKRAAAGGMRADRFLMAQAWFFCPLVILYAFATGNLVPLPAALWGSAAGVLSLVGPNCFVRSLTAGSVSTNASIFRLNFIVTVVLVIAFLGEPLTGLKIAGLLVALLAVWLLLAEGAGGDDAKKRGGIAQVVLATLCFGASNFCHTVGLRHGALPETMVAAQAALFMPLATAVVYVNDRKLAQPATMFKFAAPAAIALVIATISLLRGIAGGQASALVPIAQMGFIVAALLGIFALRERITLRKAAGIAAALAALAALAMS